MSKKKQKKVEESIVVFVLAIIIVIASYFNIDIEKYLGFDVEDESIFTEELSSNSDLISFDLSNIPEYNNEPFVIINNNIPFFSDDEMQLSDFENYSELDYLGRCGVAFAKIGVETMPTEERGEIGQVKPSGWQTVKYDIVDGKYLYNRCHLIGFQLAGENANEKNLITGTRYLNVDGMLPFENDVAEYVKETKNHVLYRVTPVFENENLVASGVQIEAKSIEDNGKTVCFNVYVYNTQPGIKINYEDGTSMLLE